MSFFDRLLGSNSEEGNTSNIEWKFLEEVNELDTVIADSFTKPVIIFKHSTRCSISRFALKQFEREFSFEGKLIPYFLDLLNYRQISNQIAELFQVEHQSPQLIVIKDGVVVFHESHGGIQASDLKRFV
ncbi:bacillithiol system redox-active protein YtxJ [Flavobacterium chuncheonense]|uniref:Bacillithiol system redox-active protein YtxJ n=1 Tax=Flavobacterium chuncheonense TaxID=2026653 RepID=A0ABW5YLQ9_9FLAO